MGDEPGKREELTQRHDEGGRTFQPALWLRMSGVVVVGGYLLLFVILNTRRVKLDFVVGTTRVSLVLAILLSLTAGVVLGVLLSQLHRRRQRSR